MTDHVIKLRKQVKMAAQKHEFTVEMTCEGCSGAVTRVLTKQKPDKVKDFSIDLPGKKVVVEATISKDELLEILQKTGKATTYVGEVN